MSVCVCMCVNVLSRVSYVRRDIGLQRVLLYGAVLVERQSFFLSFGVIVKITDIYGTK